MLTKIWKTLLIIFLFLLPWQTRWIYDSVLVNKNFWEYGSSSLYAMEILLWAVVIIFTIDKFRGTNWKRLAGKEHWKTHRSGLLAAGGFVFFLILELALSIYPSISFNYAFMILEGLCLAIIIASVPIAEKNAAVLPADKQKVGDRLANINKRSLMVAFWAGAVGQGIFALYQFFAQEVPGSKWLGMAPQLPENLGASVVQYGLFRWLRAYGSFSSPNILGGFLAVAFIVGLILYFREKRRIRFVYLLGQLFILMGLLLTFSRAAWLAVVIGWVGVGVYIISAKENRWRPAFLYVEQTFFYALISIMIFFMFQQVFLTRIEANRPLERFSLDQRSFFMLESAQIWHDHPFLGVGPGAYTAAVFHNDPKKSVFENQPVHNIYMLILAEWGAVGLVVWGTILVFLFIKVKRYNPIFFPLILAILVAASFDHYWWSLYSGIMLWWVAFGLSMNVEVDGKSEV